LNSNDRGTYASVPLTPYQQQQQTYAGAPSPSMDPFASSTTLATSPPLPGPGQPYAQAPFVPAAGQYLPPGSQPNTLQQQQQAFTYNNQGFGPYNTPPPTSGYPYTPPPQQALPQQQLALPQQQYAPTIPGPQSFSQNQDRYSMATNTTDAYSSYPPTNLSRGPSTAGSNSFNQPPPSSSGSTGSGAGSATSQSRFVLHTDMDEVVELPPQYSERRTPMLGDLSGKHS
jgi:hypothetical protein